MIKLLLTDYGVKNKGIHDALVGLVGKPIDGCNALCIPTAGYGHPHGTAFPDFDFRLNVNGNWNNWFHQPTRYSHPSIGLFNEQNFRLPMTSAQTTPCNL